MLQFLLGILEVLLSIDDILINSEVWYLIINWVTLWSLVLLAWVSSRGADWVGALGVVVMMSMLVAQFGICLNQGGI